MANEPGRSHGGTEAGAQDSAWRSLKRELKSVNHCKIEKGRGQPRHKRESMGKAPWFFRGLCKDPSMISPWRSGRPHLDEHVESDRVGGDEHELKNQAGLKLIQNFKTGECRC